jgi:hypothetical protein
VARKRRRTAEYLNSQWVKVSPPGDAPRRSGIGGNPVEIGCEVRFQVTGRGSCSHKETLRRPRSLAYTPHQLVLWRITPVRG